jgi:predicted transcriptional regulator
MTKESFDHATEIKLLNITSDIVASYSANNSVRVADIIEMIGSVYATLNGIVTGQAVGTVEATKGPAVSIKRSITPDFLICLEDGKRFKSLKRHLRSAHDMSPEDYRTTWSLPRDYPMTAPAHATRRSELATSIGFGEGRATSAVTS